VLHQLFFPSVFSSWVSVCRASAAQVLKNIPITLQFLLIGFNGIWNLFQLFITHFFSASTVEQNVYCFFSLLCMGFSPCFDSCEVVILSASFSPPHCIGLAENQGESSAVWPSGCEGAWENMSFAAFSQDYFLQLVRARLYTLHNPGTSSQQFFSPTFET